MTQRSLLIIISLLTGSLLLHGCQSVKKTLGMDRPPPDEFAVTPSAQPLDMPPDFFALPIPQPGAPRPQDIRAQNAKREKLLGIPSNSGTSSPGQAAILEMCGSTAPTNITPENEDIRKIIDTESRIEKAKGKPILESLGIKKGNAKENLNPYEESLKLQEQGIPQKPSIPTALDSQP